MKRVYLCAPAPWQMHSSVKQRWTADFYADVCSVVTEVFGKAPCLPFTEFEDTGRGRQKRRTQVKDALLVLTVPLTGSWDGGADFQVAQQYEVPTMVLCATRAVNNDHVPRLLLEDKMNCGVATYSNRSNAMERLRTELHAFKANNGLRRREPKRDPKAATAERVRLHLHKMSRRA